MTSPALEAARRHPIVAGLVGAIGTVILLHANDAGDLARAVVYLATVALGVGIIDLTTRAGAWLKRPAVGWLVASIAWALLHGPKDWAESHALPATIMGMVDIVPLGLLWGYLTHRTRGFLPAVLLHATNVWGLQNLA